MLECDKVKDICYSSINKIGKVHLIKKMISFDEFISYYIKKWKTVVLMIVIFSVVFLGGTKLFGGEIVVPHSEEYLYYEKEILWHEEYLKNSVLMSVNPTSIYVETKILENISDIDLLKNYALSVDIWDDFETNYEKKYLPELVDWNENPQTGKVELSVSHISKEESSESIEYLCEKLKIKDKNLYVTNGAGRVRVDEELQDEQNSWYDKIDYLTDLLEQAEAGFTISVDATAALLCGVLVGGFLSVPMILGMFMIKRKKD